MHTQEYDDISITDITKRAGVSRMSYYRNYNSKDEILMDYMYQIILEYAQELDLSNTKIKDDSRLKCDPTVSVIYAD